MLVNKLLGEFDADKKATFNIQNATILAIGTVGAALNSITIKATTDGGKKVRKSDQDTAEWSCVLTTDSAGSYIPLENPIQLAAARSVTFTSTGSVIGQALIIYTKELS